MGGSGLRGAGLGLRRFAMLAAAVTALGLFSGWAFAKGQPRAAAGAVIADFVEVSDSAGNAASPADPDLVAPVSGDHLGSPRCGFLVQNISNDDLLASLAAGIVVLLHGPGLSEAELAELEEFVGTRDRVLVAFEPRLEVPLVALSWSHRMALPDANLELIAAFHTALVGIAPDAVESPCPTTGS